MLHYFSVLVSRINYNNLNRRVLDVCVNTNMKVLHRTFHAKNVCIVNVNSQRAHASVSKSNKRVMKRPLLEGVAY